MGGHSIKIEDIFLRRIERKLWQFGNSPPKRVELAVLDYLQIQGWKGYFSEHFDFDRTILIMMCWCNRQSYFDDKRRSLPHENLNDYFNFATDGFWNHGLHKLSQANLIQNAENFSVEVIPKILESWQKRGVKGLAVGSPYFSKRDSKSRHATDLDAELLASFFKARGGLEYYLDYLKHFHGTESQKLKNRRKLLDRKIRKAYNDDIPRELSLVLLDGTYFQIDPSPDNHVRGKNISSWIGEISNLSYFDFKDELIKLAQDLQRHLEKLSTTQTRWTKKADLDLIIWKDSVVSVEIKAPNDRLRPHQREQLEYDNKNGIHSWVIKVHEQHQTDR